MASSKKLTSLLISFNSLFSHLSPRQSLLPGMRVTRGSCLLFILMYPLTSTCGTCLSIPTTKRHESIHLWECFPEQLLCYLNPNGIASVKGCDWFLQKNLGIQRLYDSGTILQHGSSTVAPCEAKTTMSTQPAIRAYLTLEPDAYATLLVLWG